MSAIKGKAGFPPELREELAVRDAALAGDIAMVITPATVEQAATNEAWSRKVIVEIKTADGRLHDWLTASFATKVSIADTSAAGAAATPSTTLSIVNGRAEITVTGAAAAWLAAETNTLTIASITVLGVALGSKTSVGTFA